MIPKRHLAILRENAARLRDAGAPESEIKAYLKENNTDLEQVLAVPKASPEVLNKLIENEQAGVWDQQRSQMQEVTAKATESRKRQESTERMLGDVRNIQDMLLFGAGEELESAIGGQPVQEIRQEREEYSRQYPTRNLASNIVGAFANPIGGAASKFVGSGAGLGSQIGRAALTGAATGAAYGFGGGEGGLKNRLGSAAMGAATGGTLGAAIPTVGEGIKRGLKGFARGAESLGSRVEKLPFGIGKLFSKSQDELEDKIGRLAGQGRSEEVAGSSLRTGIEKVVKDFKTRSKTLYDKADDMASGQTINLGQDSTFKQALAEASEGTTNTGKMYLNRIGKELKSKPNYAQVRSLQSKLSADSKAGIGDITANQVGRLKAALDRDIELGIGGAAKRALDKANSFYREQMQDPNSLYNAAQKLKGQGIGLSDSELGRRGIAAATSRAGKQTSLQRIIETSDNPDQIKNSIMANITRRSNFSNMSPEQQAMVYGNKLKEADDIFNGVIIRKLIQGIKNTSRTADKIGTQGLVFPATSVSQMETR